ncbi:MAG: restriction endonuclease subunit S [Acidimicrobiia bacterium]|nr:restriction endonuclease subunit S [Acidimicrobiia bacterium]
MRDGWRQMALGEAVEVTIGRQRSPKNATGPSMTPYLRAANVKDGHLLLDDVLEMNFNEVEQGTYGLQPGDVLVTEGCGSIGELGASARWTSSFETTVCFQNTLLRLRARPDLTLSGFVEHWARWAHKSGVWASTASGTNIFHIGVQRAREVPLSVPPLAEQRRIVDLVDHVDQELLRLDALIESAKRAISAMIDDLVFAGNAPLMRLKDLAPPRGLIGGPFGSSLVSTDYTGSGVPVIRGGNLSFGRYVGGDFVYVDETKATSLARNQALPGDLVATQRGTLGQVALVPHDGPSTYVISQSQMRLRSDPTVALTEFIYVALSSSRLIHEIETRKIATANPHINLGIFGDLQIPVPPVEEQRATIGVIFAAEDLVDRAQSQRVALQASRASLLLDLLTGTHRIPATYDELLDHAS